MHLLLFGNCLPRVTQLPSFINSPVREQVSNYGHEQNLTVSVWWSPFTSQPPREPSKGSADVSICKKSCFALAQESARFLLLLVCSKLAWLFQSFIVVNWNRRMLSLSKRLSKRLLNIWAYFLLHPYHVIPATEMLTVRYRKASSWRWILSLNLQVRRMWDNLIAMMRMSVVLRIPAIQKGSEDKVVKNY